MKLHTLTIEGFRRHVNTQVLFSDATFLIGENNVGKSSILSAINYLLNDIKKIPEEEFFHVSTGEGSRGVRHATKIILTAEFKDVPDEAKNWLGFKGRVLPFISDNGEHGNKIIYRKTFELHTDYVVELRQQVRTVKSGFASCETLQQYIDAGLDLSPLEGKLEGFDSGKKLTNKQRSIIEELDGLYDYDEAREEWFKNPGGIPINVLQRLPKYLLIPAQDKVEEISGNSGTLIATLGELFNDVRDGSDNYREAQKYLNQLATELDPHNEQSEFGKMMVELNGVMKDIFPNSGLSAETALSEADKVIKPQFKISMFSNINTSVGLQGTGMIRSAVFALLRYRNLRDNQRIQRSGEVVRPLLIGFEEPEIYLHPNAAQQMRNTIYDLASSEKNQIVCTTHSPYMIDLSKKPSQILNNLSIENTQLTVEEVQYDSETVKCFPFNTTLAYQMLQSDEKSYVKMLLKIDDYIARVFFSKHVLIVEGDTEDIVLRETISRLPATIKKDVECNWQIIKARGKATIISLVKYLKAMGINPIVIHDEDKGNEKAEVFNIPIANAVGDDSKVIMLSNCIEDVLGYKAPSKEKPFTAYKFISENWGEDWSNISQSWTTIVQRVFQESFKGISTAPFEGYAEVAATDRKG